MAISTRMKFIGLGLTGLLAVGVAGAVLAEGPGGPADGERAHRPVRGVLHGVVTASGLEPQVFVEGFKAGESVDTILTENGIDPDTVEAQVLEDVRARLDQAVAEDKISEEQADAAYAKAQEALPNLMSHIPDPSKHPFLRLELARGVLKTAAESIGIDPRELVSDIRGGSTIAEVATENGVDPADVISDLEAAANARIDEALANGNINEDQAAAAKAKVAEHVAMFVNEGGPRHNAGD